MVPFRSWKENTGLKCVPVKADPLPHSQRPMSLLPLDSHCPPGLGPDNSSHPSTTLGERNLEFTIPNTPGASKPKGYRRAWELWGVGSRSHRQVLSPLQVDRQQGCRKICTLLGLDQAVHLQHLWEDWGVVTDTLEGWHILES